MFYTYTVGPNEDIEAATDNRDRVFDLHIQKKARDHYRFDDALANEHHLDAYRIAQVLATAMNNLHQKTNDEAIAIHASDINAMEMLDESIHVIIGLYTCSKNLSLFERMEAYLVAEIGEKPFQALLKEMVSQFPVSSVYRNDESVMEYLQGVTNGRSHRHWILEKMLVLWLENKNPAYDELRELIDDTEFNGRTGYRRVCNALRDFLEKEPPLGEQHLSLLDMLMMPAEKYPHSLTAQLEYIYAEWTLLPEAVMTRIVQTLGFIKEEHKERFHGGPGPTYVPEFHDEMGPEQFTRDKAWMSRLVLIAKNTYVWLDQLSKKYETTISRLDQVPEQELEMLARRGFSGLWLIGLWERSNASERIKHIYGNRDAIASAYSLDEYVVAEALGGNEALLALKEKAWEKGIRLASDMVPNHMGIDSRWCREHPDWFIQSDTSPFTSYSFHGENLSDDDRVKIYLEDGYWSKTEAAVVFKWEESCSGEVRYIYHGNDGTGIPWNDTAQLNYLLPEVREAVLTTILDIARMFPVIRFDAAMTLAKEHYQRLWFPEPGSGGDIPSRSGYSMTKEEFDRVFPIEFWRELVDRVQQDAPDTLLLAEAFWMMESYFVRTLGMHRVYNSAFMHMLKNEENGKYRSLMKNVLEFNPQILKRYVNFMSNPDEETAIMQFGQDDKYFGVCVMMCTMPGLPMFGHGQLEGFREKYGMEYARAYQDEEENITLLERHRREIFPLLRKRYLFADVDNFYLYDFFEATEINENVFCYSNHFQNEKSLVIYNNSPVPVTGRIHRSVPTRNNEEAITPVTLSEGLAITGDNDTYVIFEDHATGLTYVRSCQELDEHGMYIELGPYHYHLFWNFKEVGNTQKFPYARVARKLEGKGVISLETIFDELKAGPAVEAFESMISPETLHTLIGKLEHVSDREAVIKMFRAMLSNFNERVSTFEGISKLDNNTMEYLVRQYSAIVRLRQLASKETSMVEKVISSMMQVPDSMMDNMDPWRIFILYIYMQCIDLLRKKMKDGLFLRGDLVERILFRHSVTTRDELAYAEREIALVKLLLQCPEGLEIGDGSPAPAFLEHLFSYKTVQEFIQLHYFDNSVYFNKESFEVLIHWLCLFSGLQRSISEGEAEIENELEGTYRLAKKIIRMAEQSTYKKDILVSLVADM